MIQAIETRYKGYRFRSRLEARWAVFFDELGVPWRYEPEGYLIGWPKHSKDCAPESAECTCDQPRGRYLPDFYLSNTKTWVEVKGDYERFDKQLLADAVDWWQGLPDTGDSAGSSRGLLLLGDIPEAHPFRRPVHPILQHEKGGWVNRAVFAANGDIVTLDDGDAYFDSTASGLNGYPASWKKVTLFWTRAGDMSFEEACPLRVQAACAAARSARFEHAERG